MLYLHCGWPRTSTSSLQAALYERRRELAEAGMEYPNRWLSAEYPTHHELTTVVDRLGWGDEVPLLELQRFLAARRDRDVLMSAEALSYRLHPEQSQEALLRFLAALHAGNGVRCVWALRRMDELIASLYLLQLSRGAELPSPTAYFEQRAGVVDGRFAGMRCASEAVGGTARYVKYEPGGTYLAKLLLALEVPQPVRGRVLAALARGPRLNSAVTQKQAIALVHLDALASRAGQAFDRESLRQAIYRGELSFDDDRPCELVGDAIRRELHERALAAAERQGFEAYGAFFGNAEVGAAAPVSLEPELLEPADLERLAAVAGSPGGP